MKQYLSIFASRLAVIALALIVAFGFAACGSSSDDNLEPPLSDKTTPVTFQFNNGISYIFDYSGNHYLGSDTIEKFNGRPNTTNDIDINLRQGQHHIICFEGLSKWSSGTHFNPQTMSVEISNSQTAPENARYAEFNLNVSEYLLPKQAMDFQLVTARLGIGAIKHVPRGAATARIIGLPTVTSVEIMGNGFKVSNDAPDTEISIKENAIFSFLYESNRILCPTDGLNDLQLSIEFKDYRGNVIDTIQLPKVSLKRGYYTSIAEEIYPETYEWVTSELTYEEIAEWEKIYNR